MGESGNLRATDPGESLVRKTTVNPIALALANMLINNTYSDSPGQPVYTVSLSGVGSPFTSPVTLTATGLPADATVTFGTLTYGSGAMQAITAVANLLSCHSFTCESKQP